jgi:hypothetical protein
MPALRSQLISQAREDQRPEGVVPGLEITRSATLQEEPWRVATRAIHSQTSLLYRSYHKRIPGCKAWLVYF